MMNHNTCRHCECPFTTTECDMDGLELCHACARKYLLIDNNRLRKTIGKMNHWRPWDIFSVYAVGYAIWVFISLVYTRYFH